VSRFVDIGGARLLCQVSNQEYLFGRGCAAPASRDWQGFAFPDYARALVTGNLPDDVFAAAIAESSEVRSVWVNGVRVTEGSPVMLRASKGTALSLERDDLTDGHLDLVLLTRECPTAFLALPTLILDHARIRVNGLMPDDVNGIAYYLVQAPRIRGVRHVAAVFAADRDGAGTGSITGTPVWLGKHRDTHAFGQETLAEDLRHDQTDPHTDWLVGSASNIVAAWSTTLVEAVNTIACSGDAVLFRLINNTATGANFGAVLGWCAP
jgi:hypothetical protein